MIYFAFEYIQHQTLEIHLPESIENPNTSFSNNLNILLEEKEDEEECCVCYNENCNTITLCKHRLCERCYNSLIIVLTLRHVLVVESLYTIRRIKMNNNLEKILELKIKKLRS